MKTNSTNEAAQTNATQATNTAEQGNAANAKVNSKVSTTSAKKRKATLTLNAKQSANPSANSATNSAQKKIISAEQRYLQNKARFFMLKCLVELGYFNRFIAKVSYNYDDIAEFLGFYDICDSEESYKEDKKGYKSKILNFCADEFCALQKLKKQGKFGSHRILESNLLLLQETLGLNSTEFALLELIAIVEEMSVFKSFFKHF